MIWSKRPPLAFSMAETSVAEMTGSECPWPKCPTFDFFRECAINDDLSPVANYGLDINLGGLLG